jgi:nucleotide-binding universal stress UspA family protein
MNLGIAIAIAAQGFKNRNDKGGYTWVLDKQLFDNKEARECTESVMRQFRCKTNMAFTLSDKPTTAGYKMNDGVNSIVFDAPGYELPDGTVAYCDWVWYSCVVGNQTFYYIPDFDCRLSTDFEWYYGKGKNPKFGMAKLRYVLFHEIGHALQFGHVNEETVNYAKKHNSDLIIMASHGISSLSERIMGSHTEYVAMHSTVPLLSIKHDPGTSIPKSIVFAGDFKEEDIPNCEVVLELQKAFQASITLLRVNTPRNFLSNDEALKHMHSFAEKHQINHAEFAVFDDVDVEDGILHFSAEHHIDMLVIGSMQRTGLNKMINGCVSADLVNHATKPLLTFALKA